MPHPYIYRTSHVKKEIENNVYAIVHILKEQLWLAIQVKMKVHSYFPKAKHSIIVPRPITINSETYSWLKLLDQGRTNFGFINIQIFNNDVFMIGYVHISRTDGLRDLLVYRERLIKYWYTSTLCDIYSHQPNHTSPMWWRVRVVILFSEHFAITSTSSEIKLFHTIRTTRIPENIWPNHNLPNWPNWNY